MGASPARYPDAFRVEAVELVWSSERRIPQIARDLGINEQTLRNWVKRAEIDAGRGAVGELTTDDHEVGWENSGMNAHAASGGKPVKELRTDRQ
jgi:transposase-like protein